MIHVKQPSQAPKKPRRPPNHIEHQHQIALIHWARVTRLTPAADVKEGARIADYLLAIPNGGRRDAREGARLKAEGVKAGVSDLLLPLRRGGYAGMWLELKAPGERPTELQAGWIERMERAGYFATWADSWEKAAQAIGDYLDGEPCHPHTIPKTAKKGRTCSASSAN